MNDHRFDPIAAILGILTIVAGIGVAVRFIGSGSADTNLGAVVAAVALLVGLALIPWGRSTGIATSESDELDPTAASLD